MLRKLTVHTATGLTKAEIAAIGREKKTPLYHVAGHVTGTVTYTHETYGEGYGLKGVFECADVVTGEMGRASTYYPPRFATENVIETFNSLREEDPFASVKLAWTVGVEPSETSSVGYAYFVKELLLDSPDPTASRVENVLDDLRELFPAPLSQLQLESADTKKAK